MLIELEVDVDDGRLVIKRFCAERQTEGGAITMDSLKSLPLVSMAAMAAQAGILSGIVRVQTTSPGNYQVDPVTAEEVEALPELERVALFYRAALFCGEAPTTWVAEALKVSRDVAAKRVQAARRAGLLEPTTKGRKGA